MATLIRGATVLALDGDTRVLDDVDVLIEGERISAIGRDVAAPPDVTLVEGRGKLVMPGLINAHFHSPANLMRGSLDSLPLEIFMLYEVPPLASRHDNARLSYVRTLLGAMEMVKCGVTTVMDDAFHVPIATVDGIDAICAAYRDIGMRARVAIDQPNVVEYRKYPYLEKLLPPEIRRSMDAAPVQSTEELVELYRHLIQRWDGAAGGRITAALSCSAPQRVTKPYLHALSELSRSRRLPFNIHILETKLQRVLGDAHYGRSLVRYAADEGALGRHTVVIHAIWVDDADMQLLADSGATVAHNPVCNLRLGSGVAPFRAWRNAGIPVCLGTDELIADDRANVWDAMKMTGLVHNLADPDWRTWPTASEILDVAMRGGARALGFEGLLGRLAPGAAADLVVVDLSTAYFTPRNDLERQLVYCENGRSVRDVMVAGRWVVRNGRITTVDEAALLAEVRALAADSREEIRAMNSAAAKLEPYYREMVLRAHGQDVGLSRRFGS